MKSVRSRSPFLAFAVLAQLALAVSACDQAPEPQAPDQTETAVGEAQAIPRPGCDIPCPEGTRCELDQVVCVRAPCPPIPRCVPVIPVPKPGRCAVTYCPPGTRCVEVPPFGVRCVPDEGGQKCGDNVCGAKEFCCNASCGICAPRGNFCPQVICPPKR